MRTKICQNVLRSFASDRHRIIAFLDLIVGCLNRRVIRNRRCLYNNICSLCFFLAGFKHICCAAHASDIHVKRLLGTCMCCHHGNIRTSLHSGFCQCKAHLACGMIGNKTDRIDRFLRCTCCHKHF